MYAPDYKSRLTTGDYNKIKVQLCKQYQLREFKKNSYSITNMKFYTTQNKIKYP